MKTKIPVYSNETVSAVSDTDAITTTVRFEDTENVFFEPTKGGMQVVMKGEPLPPFEGNLFNEEFRQHLRQHEVSGLAQDLMYEAVYEGLRKGMAIDAMMKCMK